MASASKDLLLAPPLASRAVRAMPKLDPYSRVKVTPQLRAAGVGHATGKERAGPVIDFEARQGRPFAPRQGRHRPTASPLIGTGRWLLESSSPAPRYNSEQPSELADNLLLQRLRIKQQVLQRNSLCVGSSITFRLRSGRPNADSTCVIQDDMAFK